MEYSDKLKDPIYRASARKGGLRTIPFIIVNEAFERIASFGLKPNMILYLTNGYHMNTASGTSIIFLWTSASSFLAILGAFISDSWLGRFRVIALGSIISLIGMSQLWLTAMFPQAKPAHCYSPFTECQQPTFPQLALLLSSLGFISIGAGCIRPCSMAFGADQLVAEDTLETNQRVVGSYFNWYYASVAISAVIALTVIVYIQDRFGMEVGLSIPAVLMLLSASLFLLGSPLYVKIKPHRSLFTGLAQVLVAAFRNRHQESIPDNLDGYYFHRMNSNSAALSDKLRFLNKACIVTSSEENFKCNGSAAKPWKLCDAEQVEDLKALIKVIPIWSSGIMFYTTFSQSTITILQANTMDRHITSNFQIPAGSFNFFEALLFIIWIALYDRVVVPMMVRCTGRPCNMSPTQRMRIGLIMSCVAMAVAGIVETIRRRTAIEEGLSDDPKAVVGMSAMWLIPQASLIGLAEGFNAVGQIEYYYSQLPKSMSSIGMVLYSLGTGFGGLLGSVIVNGVDSVTKSGGRVSWLSTNLNKGHYEYYFSLLTFLSLLNYVYFLCCCRSSVCQDVRASCPNERADLEEKLLSKV